MHPNDVPEIHHIACQAVLAMAARAVAEKEFETDDEIHAVHITVKRADAGRSDVDMEFVSAGGFPMGGVSL